MEDGERVTNLKRRADVSETASCKVALRLVGLNFPGDFGVGSVPHRISSCIRFKAQMVPLQTPMAPAIDLHVWPLLM